MFERESVTQSHSECDSFKLTFWIHHTADPTKNREKILIEFKEDYYYDDSKFTLVILKFVLETSTIVNKVTLRN